ncbi:MAG: GNAT family N-acetyltransferase [Acidobacteriia bacterium]|nr:GNAT family N-acetyltransferase [Terriglobia bacterium]
MAEAAKQTAISIVEASTPEQVEQARALFLEYADSLGFSLCFQSFDQELAELPGKYARPEGRLLLAFQGGRIAGCVAMRRLEGDICEMKRLYVRPDFRGTGAGRTLAQRIIAEAKAAGYRRMRLDTITGKMDRAIALYRALGFREIPPYGIHPISGTLFMELTL